MKGEVQINLEELIKYKSFLDTDNLLDGESLYVNEALDKTISIYTTDGSELMLFDSPEEFERQMGIEFNDIGEYQLVFNEKDQGQLISLLPLIIAPNFARLDS